MGQTFKGYSIVFIPRSWEIGVWHKPNGYRFKKSIYAFGPFRFVRYYALGAWKPEPEFEPAINRGVWLKGPSPSEHTGDGNALAGNCMEPIDYDASERDAHNERVIAKAEGYNDGLADGIVKGMTGEWPHGVSR